MTMILFIRALTSYKKDKSKRATYIMYMYARAHTHSLSRVCTYYIQKSEGEREVEREGRLMKEVSCQVSFACVIQIIYLLQIDRRMKGCGWFCP